MRALFSSVLFAICAALLVSPAQAQGYTGSYVGTYTASKLPGQQITIWLYFRQSHPTTMTGSYNTGSGVSGICQGPVSGNVANLICRNVTPSCPGTYRGRYTFSSTGVTWTYSGRDCLGNETGAGAANRLPF